MGRRWFLKRPEFALSGLSSPNRLLWHCTPGPFSRSPICLHPQPCLRQRIRGRHSVCRHFYHVLPSGPWIWRLGPPSPVHNQPRCRRPRLHPMLRGRMKTVFCRVRSAITPQRELSILPLTPARSPDGCSLQVLPSRRPMAIGSPAPLRRIRVRASRPRETQGPHCLAPCFEESVPRLYTRRKRPLPPRRRRPCRRGSRPERCHRTVPWFPCRTSLYRASIACQLPLAQPAA